ncbi:hypothetical protein ALO96_103480, partial [Pseudomonas savastanoi pv. glycinea]
MENSRARIQRLFRLRLTATDAAAWLRLIASELAFSRIDLHSIVSGSSLAATEPAPASTSIKRGFFGQKPRSRRRHGRAGVTESSKSVHIS